MSHHRIDDFSSTSPVSGAEFSSILAASEGVVLHVTGHGHQNESAAYEGNPGSEEDTLAADHGYWELMLASTLDFPMHSRIIELVDEGNGHISIYATNIDHNSPVDSLAHFGRETGAAARVFPGFHEVEDIDAWWAAEVLDMNLLLRIPISAAISEELARHDWPDRIESEETLAGFTLPDELTEALEP